MNLSENMGNIIPRVFRKEQISNYLSDVLHKPLPNDLILVLTVNSGNKLDVVLKNDVISIGSEEYLFEIAQNNLEKRYNWKIQTDPSLSALMNAKLFVISAGVENEASAISNKKLLERFSTVVGGDMIISIFGNEFFYAVSPLDAMGLMMLTILPEQAKSTLHNEFHPLTDKLFYYDSKTKKISEYKK